jgi:DhnA family fructose-bisphosphate aldolase class Ia
MKGWEFPEQTLERIIEGRPDGLMTNFGILKQFSPLLSDHFGTILRVDGGPSYLLEEWPDYSRWEAFFSVEDAINVGADAVIINAFIGGRSEVDCFRVATKMASDCLKLGVPCAFEPIPSGKMVKNEFSPEMIAFACRMAAEFGADFIKTLYTGDPESFKYVTTRCPIPVLMAGGPKLDSERSLLEAVKGMIEGGGSGIFVGRNVWQHQNPQAMLAALRKVIHENASVEEALEFLR